MSADAREPLAPLEHSFTYTSLKRNWRCIGVAIVAVLSAAAVVAGVVIALLNRTGGGGEPATQREADRVTGLPGFPAADAWGFEAYSGMLGTGAHGPVGDYDGLMIHYQFHTSQRDPANDPVVIWHQGGPGGSSIIIGLYNEMGAFQIGDASRGSYMNPWAWNKVANMLYLESPAGSGQAHGYSHCLRDADAGPGVRWSPVACEWNDQTQAEAYAHTLLAFFELFPEFAGNEFYLSGESYFGQYGPNIAHFILENEPFNTRINLKGILAGNACWGGTESCVACNGPSADKIDVDFLYGKGLFSPKLKARIDETCHFPSEYGPGTDHVSPFDCDAGVSARCRVLLDEMRAQVGPYNVYNVYDNCPATAEFIARTGKNMSWLASTLRDGLHDGIGTRQYLTEMNGGYDWDCNGDAATWITSPDVRQALHLSNVEPGASSFSYNCSGPASIVLWPELAKKIRVLIYNGDADACVPYNGNEAWIRGLESQGVIEETSPWTPWFQENNVTAAGYLTKYQAPGNVDLIFATIRLAGHMVPTVQPQTAFTMFARFLAEEL